MVLHNPLSYNAELKPTTTKVVAYYIGIHINTDISFDTKPTISSQMRKTNIYPS